jgi:hypothetical protein
MEELLFQIETTLGARAYYASLFLCLCVPDICAALDSANGEASGARYKAWCVKYFRTETERRTGDYYKGMGMFYSETLDANEVYLLRCAALHQGQLTNTGTGGRAGSKYSKIIFQEPGQRLVVTHLMTTPGQNGQFNVLHINLTDFCKDMIVAAREWIMEVAGTEPYEHNSSVMFKRYPNGLAPHIVGLPIIT